MGVPPKRHGGIGVTEATGDRPHVDPRGQHLGGGPVAQVVESDVVDAGSEAQAPEPLGGSVRVKRP